MIKAVLLDIEGTTTPIDFVHKTLFPYAKSRIGEFVETHFANLHEEIRQLVEEGSSDASYKLRLDPSGPASVSSYLQHLIDHDRKSTPLKSIQGMIWKDGYESGELESKVFDDVPPAFERWTSSGKMIAIFSSGSVLAQQLLFRYTDHGDLTSFISNYFDTNIGAKRDAGSYRKISNFLGFEPLEIVFLSDIVDELNAAKEAGMDTALLLREGNAEVSQPHPHRSVSSFNELQF